MEQNQNQQPQPPVFNPQQQQVPPQMPQYQPRVTARPMMGFIEAVKTCLKKYCDFKGRARRSEYWWFVLANFCASIVLSFLGNLINFPWLTTILSLALLIPSLGLTARRLHDIGKSGHLLWLTLICGIGYLIPLFMVIKDGDPQPNQYGESPKFKEE
jgi:uncharacterized membrane protein YhaH (DUF805 family)